MRLRCLLTACSLIFWQGVSAQPTFLWAGHMGGNFIDAKDIAVDDCGNSFVTGYFGSTADFDPGAGFTYLTSAGSHDAYVCRLSDQGSLMWAVRVGGTGSDIAYSLALDANN